MQYTAANCTSHGTPGEKTHGEITILSLELEYVFFTEKQVDVCPHMKKINIRFVLGNKTTGMCGGNWQCFKHTIEAVDQLQQNRVLLYSLWFLMFHTFSLSVSTEHVDDIGNSYHRGNTPLFDSQLTKASYLKNKNDNDMLSCPLVIILFHITQVMVDTQVNEQNN